MDLTIVGSGPNGLTAAAFAARAGLAVRVVEAAPTIGGGTRTEEVTLPGFHHDICSAIHPMGVVSPAFAELDLASRVEFIHAPHELAHPFDDGTAAVLSRSLAVTADSLGTDGEAWARLMRPYVERSAELMADTLRPLRIPRHPILMLRFGLNALRSAHGLAHARFEEDRARAIFAGCAAHSFLSLRAAGTASFGLMLAVVAHDGGWPIVRGGSRAIAAALADIVREHGGEIVTDSPVRSLADLPPSRFVMFDLTPRQILAIAGDALPSDVRDGFRTYRYGPGAFKIDWALAGPIPWRSPDARRAATVHVGGSYNEIARAEAAMADGRHAEQPFVLVAQQSLFDPTRAPAGAHTGWGYCHVPNGSTVDMTERIEAQIERFAPGFRDLILARRTMTAMDIERHNPNMVGGDIGGGSNRLLQFLFRPIPRLDPYTLDDRRLFICSSSTPPGGGVHGMCGYWAARSLLRRITTNGENKG